MSLHLGLDLGGTNIKAAVVTSEGIGGPEVTLTGQWPTDAQRGPEGVTERLIEVANAMIADAGAVATVGVGVPGLFDAERGIIELFPNLPGPWKGHPLAQPISDALGLPTTLINDARAFVLAEGTLGAGRGHRTLVGITLGTGIGGGIMIDGKVHLGAFGKGGEIGHQIVLPGGPPCGCGNQGCVEPLTMASRLTELAGVEDVAEVYARAADGDAACVDAIASVADYLAIGLANVVALLGPSCIIIGGGIASAGDDVIRPIRDALRRYVTLVPVEEIDVVPAALGNWAGSIGAALAGRDQPGVLAR